MSKIFTECGWEDDLPSVGTSFSFTNKSASKAAKDKKKKSSEESRAKGNSNQKLNNQDKPTGWSVLLSKQETSHGKSDKKAKVSGTGENSDKPNIKKSDEGKGKKRKAPEEWQNGKNVTGSAKLNEKTSPKSSVPAPGKKAKAKPMSENGSNHTEHPAIDMKKDTAKRHKNGPESGNLREKLIERLKGSRFRFINEQLYKTTGEEAKKLFQEDPESFMAYHEGYRHQIAQWSMNPLDRIIKSIRKLPKDTIVADFGCGEARLAASIPNQTYSLDLVSHNSSVVACDMANTPLESSFVNLVVFCLSLMGTNLADFLLEANRVLKVGGTLKIAEVSSRFDNVNEFVGNVKKCGFELVNKDMKHKLFYFFNFKKSRTVIKGSTKIKPFSLKPCLYKKR